MIRRHLAEIVKQKTTFSATECDRLVEQVFEIVSGALEKGEEVKISGFGKFRVRQKRARTGRNPKTGEQLEIRARRIVTFQPSLLLPKKMGGGISNYLGFTH